MWPGQRMKAKVRIEPSDDFAQLAAERSAVAHVRGALIAEFACGLPVGAVVGRKDENGVVIDRRDPSARRESARRG